MKSRLGELPRPLSGKRVTVKEVAEAAGVSLMGASLALRGKTGPGGVSQALVDRVGALAEKMGYMRNLRRGRKPSYEGAVLFYVPTEKDVALARFYCQPWRGRGIEDEELWGEAMVALMMAATSFDPSRGASFGTCLMWKVRSRLRAQFAYRATRDAGRGCVFLQSLDDNIGDDDPRKVAELIPAEDRSESARYVRELLGFVSPVERTVLEMRYVDCLLPTEVARQLRKPVGEVLAGLESGISKLREAVGVTRRNAGISSSGQAAALRP